MFCVCLKYAGVILKVQAQVKFPNFSRNTPVMQAVLFEDPSDARFLKAWPVFQVRSIKIYLFA